MTAFEVRSSIIQYVFEIGKRGSDKRRMSVVATQENNYFHCKSCATNCL